MIFEFQDRWPSLIETTDVNIGSMLKQLARFLGVLGCQWSVSLVKVDGIILEVGEEVKDPSNQIQNVSVSKYISRTLIWLHDKPHLGKESVS